MDMSQSTRKWSELHDIAVVSVADGKKIGTCDDFYFDPNTHSIYAIQVKTGLMSHKVLPVSYISAFGQDAIVIASDEGLRSKSKDERVTTLSSGQSLHSFKVMGTSGTLIGTVGNVLLDTSTPTTLKIAAFELARSLRERLGRQYPTFPATQVVSYGEDVLVIPDEAVQRGSASETTTTPSHEEVEQQNNDRHNDEDMNQSASNMQDKPTE